MDHVTAISSSSDGSSTSQAKVVAHRGFGVLLSVILATALVVACVSTAVAYLLITREVNQQRCQSLTALVAVTNGSIKTVLEQEEHKDGCEIPAPPIGQR